MEDTTKGVKSNEFARLICEQEDEVARSALFALAYFEEFGSFPIKIMNETMDELQKPDKLKELRDKVVQNIPDNDEQLKMLDQFIIGQAANAVVVKQFQNVLAREVVKASIGGAAAQGGRRAAIVVVEKGATMMFASGALAAAANPWVGVGSFVGEMAATIITQQLGIDNPSIQTAAGIAGGILAAVATGAVIGGPVGAAGGAIVGVIGAGVSEGVKALFRTGRGPNDNWAFCVTGDVDGTICFGTYAGDDGVYAKTYGNQGQGANDCKVISAGQKQDYHFQLSIWNHCYIGARCWTTFTKVHYRDFIYVSKVNGREVIVICYGGHSHRPGTSERLMV